MSSQEMSSFASGVTSQASELRPLVSDKTKEMRILEGRFPGLEKDSRVERIFRDETTGKVTVLGLDQKPDPISYYLGGDVDWEIQVRTALRTGNEKNFVGPFYEPAEITQLS